MLALPSIERLSILLSLLEQNPQAELNSSDIADMLGVPAARVRKDFSLANITLGRGKHSAELLKEIKARLGLDKVKKTCLVGLGKLGQALLQYPGITGASVSLAAGFDSDINLLERLKSDVPLFPAYEISEVAAEKGIELGILAVPASSAQDCAEKLIRGGVRGIINFTHTRIKIQHDDIYVRDIYLVEEFSILSALISQGEKV